MARKAVTHASIQAKIKRWRTRARRALNAIDKLEKQERALVRRAAALPRQRPDNAAPIATVPITHARSEETALDIPTYLKRSGGETPKVPGNSPDSVADEIKRGIEENKAKGPSLTLNGSHRP